MAKYLITYDLRGVRDYDAVYEKMQGWKAVPLLESVWLAAIAGTAEDVINALRKVSDFDDGLSVLELKPGSDWTTIAVPDRAVSWLRKNITP